MTIVLSLLSALCYGTSDFVGGVVSTRVSAWTAAITSQVGGAIAILLLASVSGGDPGLDVGWAGLSGVASAVGVVALYRGLAVGRMGVVAPVSGLLSAGVPALIGVATGDRPSVLAWTGIALALPAVALVAASPRTAAEVDRQAGTSYGVLAGVGFGLSFSAVSQMSPDAGHWPVGYAMAVGALITALLATVARASWVPRRRLDWLPCAFGPLAAAALALFLEARHHGLLTVAAVLCAMYPAATVCLAVLILKERIHRAQAIGLALCAAAVALVAAG